MDKDFLERVRLMHETVYRQEYSKDIVAVLNSEPGEYENNPTIIEYKEKGYRLFDANMCGSDNELGGNTFVYSGRKNQMKL